MKRSLYQCLNAKYPKEGKKITCSKGHKLPKTSSVLSLAKGAPLEFGCCQECVDFSSMGDSIPKNERGWAHLK